MKDKIVITYETETLNIECLAPRDKAIYQAGVDAGIEVARAEKADRFAVFAVVLFAGIIVVTLFLQQL